MNKSIEKPISTLLDFFELCVVFVVVFGLVIGGGIFVFRFVYLLVS